jgi:hypothetical protein
MRLEAVYVLVSCYGVWADLVFRVPQSKITLIFPAARGGCLSGIVNGETGFDLLARPLDFGLSGPPTNDTLQPCRNATLRVLRQNDTALSFISTPVVGLHHQSGGAMKVDLVMQDFGPAVIAYSGFQTPGAAWNVVGSMALHTPPNPWVPYEYTMDGVPATSLGTARCSETITEVSNWVVGASVAPPADGAQVAPHATSGVRVESGLADREGDAPVVAAPVCGEGACCVVGQVDSATNTTVLTLGCSVGPFTVEFDRLI